MSKSINIQVTTIKVSVTMDGDSFTMTHHVPKHGTPRQKKAGIVRDLADEIASFIEAPRKSKGERN